MPMVKLKPDDPNQSERFIEKARELDVDESGETFEHAFEKIVPSAKAKIVGRSRRPKQLKSAFYGPLFTTHRSMYSDKFFLYHIVGTRTFGASSPVSQGNITVFRSTICLATFFRTTHA